MIFISNSALFPLLTIPCKLVLERKIQTQYYRDVNFYLFRVDMEHR